MREKDKKIKKKNCLFFSWVWPSYQVVYTEEQNKKPGLQVPQRRMWGSLPGRRTTGDPSRGAPLPGGPVRLVSKDRAEATSRQSRNSWPFSVIKAFPCLLFPSLSSHKEFSSRYLCGVCVATQPQDLHGKGVTNVLRGSRAASAPSR